MYIELVLLVILILLILKFLFIETFQAETLSDKYALFKSKPANMEKVKRFFDALSYKEGLYYLNGELIECIEPEKISTSAPQINTDSTIIIEKLNQIRSVYNKLNSYKINLDGKWSDITAKEDSFNTKYNDINTLKNNVVNNKGNIDRLYGYFRDLGTNKDNVISNDNTNWGHITNNWNDINTYQTSANTKKNECDTLKTDIESLTTQINTLKTQISDRYNEALDLYNSSLSLKQLTLSDKSKLSQIKTYFNRSNVIKNNLLTNPYNADSIKTNVQTKMTTINSFISTIDSNKNDASSLKDNAQKEKNLNELIFNNDTRFQGYCKGSKWEGHTYDINTGIKGLGTSGGSKISDTQWNYPSPQILKQCYIKCLTNKWNGIDPITSCEMAFNESGTHCYGIGETPPVHRSLHGSGGRHELCWATHPKQIKASFEGKLTDVLDEINWDGSEGSEGTTLYGYSSDGTKPQ